MVWRVCPLQLLKDQALPFLAAAEVAVQEGEEELQPGQPVEAVVEQVLFWWFVPSTVSKKSIQQIPAYFFSYLIFLVRCWPGKNP